MLKDVIAAGRILLRNRCDPGLMAAWLKLEFERWESAQIAEATKINEAIKENQ